MLFEACTQISDTDVGFFLQPPPQNKTNKRKNTRNTTQHQQLQQVFASIVAFTLSTRFHLVLKLQLFFLSLAKFLNINYHFC